MSYASAEITFIDRDSNKKTACTYPVTSVILRERDNPENKRVFIVDDEGKWKEEK